MRGLRTHLEGSWPPQAPEYWYTGNNFGRRASQRLVGAPPCGEALTGADRCSCVCGWLGAASPRPSTGAEAVAAGRCRRSPRAQRCPVQALPPLQSCPPKRPPTPRDCWGHLRTSDPTACGKSQRGIRNVCRSFFSANWRAQAGNARSVAMALRPLFAKHRSRHLGAVAQLPPTCDQQRVRGTIRCADGRAAPSGVRVAAPFELRSMPAPSARHTRHPVSSPERRGARGRAAV